MRLSACTGGVLLAATACAGLPESIRIDVDGRMLEVRQQGLPSSLLARGWSLAPECGERGREEVELIGFDGKELRLYRCRP